MPDWAKEVMLSSAVLEPLSRECTAPFYTFYDPFVEGDRHRDVPTELALLDCGAFV